MSSVSSVKQLFSNLFRCFELKDLVNEVQEESNLFFLYKANKFQKLLFLQIPSALPFFLSGLKISAGLSLIGAIVAEFVTGIGGSSSGLAYIIIESSYRLETAKMFAALILIALTGIIIYVFIHLISKITLKNWHESEKIKEL